ncbi:MAG: hypothetical protein GY719_06100 [bacterium]|nr:hypothetical protein [bacterium]
MGSDIVSDANEIASAIRAVLVKPGSRQAADDLIRRLGTFQKQVGTIAANARKLRKPTNRAAGVAGLRKVKLPADTESESRTERAGSREPRKTVEIESFFHQVSDSLVQTQSRLNELSLDYVRGLDPRIAPAYYAIPSLKAEMKVGFHSAEDEKLNLILFSRSEEKQDFGESTVTFELVAAPPPPGEAPFGELNVPTPRFLTLGDEKSRLLNEARRLAGAEGKDLGKTFDKTEESGLAQVLRFEPGPGERAAKSARYLVLWPSQHANTRDPAKWREVLVMPLVEDSEGVRIDRDFPFKSGATLCVADNDPASAAALVGDLADALNHVAIAIRDWTEAVRPPSVGAAAGS